MEIKSIDERRRGVGKGGECRRKRVRGEERKRKGEEKGDRNKIISKIIRKEENKRKENKRNQTNRKERRTEEAKKTTGK